MFHNIWVQAVLNMLALTLIGCIGVVAIRRTFRGNTMVTGIAMIVLGGVLFIPVPIIAIHNPTMDMTAREALCLTYGVAVFSVGFISMLACPQSAYRPKQPTIRIWTHDRMTIIAADEDYQLGRQQMKREEVAFGRIGKRYVAPKLYALMPDNPDFSGQFLSRTFYEVLIKGCNVERSEMFVPRWTSPTTESVKPEVLWRLVHGAQPPAELIAGMPQEAKQS